jgi:hypothetical protein
MMELLIVVTAGLIGVVSGSYGYSGTVAGESVQERLRLLCV